MNRIKELLAVSPIIAAVKDDESVELAIKSDCDIVFTLFGSICDIGRIVQKIKDAGKVCFVHADLVEGLALKETAARFIKENTAADGVISTKPAVIKAAREQGLMTIHRCFLLDSKSLDSFLKQVSSIGADCVEVLPGAMPKVIKRVVAATKIPVIAGGLINDKEDAITALEAGADGISIADLMKNGASYDYVI